MQTKLEGQARTATGKRPSARYTLQRERIISAATILLNGNGVAGVTLQEVAERLGLKTTAITYYFRYKDELIAAVFSSSLDRLAAMVNEAGAEPTPHARVDRYLKIFFDQYADVLRGRDSPLAILSEIRTLEGDDKARLIARYQEVFRGVRAFFGAIDGDDRKREFSVRAHILNEAIFWGALWLDQNDISEFGEVRRRLLDILAHGVSATRPEQAPAIYDLAVESGNGDSRSSFLKVMTRLLNEAGYRAASVDRAAAEINLTKGSFYHHLQTKSDIILECFMNSHRRLRDLKERAARDGLTHFEILRTFIYSALQEQFEGDWPLLRTTALQALPATLRGRALQYLTRTSLLLSGILVDAMGERAIRPVDPTLASHLILSTINSAFDVRGPATVQGVAQTIERYVDAIMHGILE